MRRFQAQKSGKSAMPRARVLTMVGTLTILLAATRAAAPPKDVAGVKAYRDVAQPFIERNCLRCHGAQKAMAGFRVDRLGLDFTAARVADHWKEVIDRINA